MKHLLNYTEHLRESLKLPSHFQVEEKVCLKIMDLEGNVISFIPNCIVQRVEFSDDGKVRYDIGVILGEEKGQLITTSIQGIDSVWVIAHLLQ